MRVSILTIGDELLIGQVLNSNVQWMSEKLTEIGCTVAKQMTVGDALSEIKAALDFLIPASDAIIIGGGLGPTHDDLTMEALSNYFSIPLEYDTEWISQVEAYFKARNRVMSENNKKQGYLLKTANRIDNDCGTAAGQHLEQPKLDLFVVPGVPHEMKSMMDRYILPALKRKTTRDGENILQQSLLTTGLGESLLAERIDAFVQKIKTIPTLTLAFLPSSVQVRLRLQMRAKTPVDRDLFESLTEELKELCGKDFFGMDPITLEEIVIQFLRSRKETLALAESCTGGFLSHRLTQVSGASEALRGTLVPYQTDLKESELGISQSSLKEKGVVSEFAAKAMAEAVRKKWNTTYGIATTGYLGPTGGDEFAKVGTVWIAVSSEFTTEARMFVFENNRERAKERAAQASFDLFRRTFSLSK
jgi:nicotinamide-nucleotide amidase